MAEIVQIQFQEQLSKKDRLVIIPAAGFGTRVGSPPAKELLPHPHYPHLNFLEKAIERANFINAIPLVVTRTDKEVLNLWLEERQIPHLQVTQTSEWVESVRLTEMFWKKRNLLLLPDTDFSPESILEDLIEYEIGAGVFQVEDLRLWGGIEQNRISEKLSAGGPGLAWGVLSFSQEKGKFFWDLYEKAQKTQNWVSLPVNIEMLKLNWFKDLTR